MIIPVRARPKKFRQVELFDLPIKGSKALSPLVGDLYNELVRVIVGGESLTTNGQIELCPDIFVKDDASFIEVKASERSNYFKLSRYQLDKYRKVSKLGRKVYYAFAVYSAGKDYRPVFRHLPKNIDGIRTIQGALKFIAERTQRLLIIDFEILDTYLEQLPYIDQWGKADQEVPSKFKGLYRFKVKDIDKFCFNPIDKLISLGLDIADYEVTRTDIVGLRAADIEFCRFPFVRINKKIKRDYNIDLNNIDWLKCQALEAFSADEEDEDEPF